MSFFDSGALRDGAPQVRRRRTWLVLLLFVLLAVAGYLGLHRYAADRVPVGVSVEGVAIGGQPTGSALARLQARLGAELNSPVDVTYNGQTYHLDAATSGFTIDYAATLRSVGATGSRWAPDRIWRFYTEGGDRSAVIRVDRTRFARALAALTRQIGRPAVEGTVAFRDGTAVPVYGRSGLAIDQSATTKLVRNLLFGTHPGELPMTVRRPYVSAHAVRAAMHAFGEPAMSGPVHLDIGGRVFSVSPDIFGKALRMVPHDGSLEPLVDPAQLHQVLDAGLRTIGDKPVDATVALHGDRPAVVPAVYGAAYEDTALARAFVAALTESGAARAVHIHAAITAPAVTTADARDWHVTAKVASIVVDAPASSLEPLDGRVLAPGRTLTVADVLDQPSLASVSGVFAAALHAGLDISALTPPPRLHSDLPVGEQAEAVTLGAPAGTHWLFSVRRLGDRKAVLTVWGAPQPKVRVVAGRHTAVTPPGTTTSAAADCLPRAGVAGFTVTVHRTGNGRPRSVVSTYAPVDAVVCGASASPSSAP